MSNITGSSADSVPRIMLYKSNRLDAEGTWSVPVAELATWYAASPWCASPIATHTSLRIFLAEASGPVGSLYDDSTPEFARLLELAVEADRAQHSTSAGVA